MNKPIGCLSRSGLAAALLALVVLVGVGLVWGGRLFSPGPLNSEAGGEPLGGVRSHAETGGRCSACHAAPWSSETMADRCVVCHTDIAAQMGDPTSLHGVVMASGQDQPCYACHPEHRGEDAPLTTLDPGTFPHQATGYSLEGHQQMASGAPFACADCHADDLTLFDPARCVGCHRGLDAASMQAHESAFGSDCLACHDGLDTYGASFDHAQTAFPLAGQHAPLACAGCHQGARTIADLRAAPQDCVGCHDDPVFHRGLLGTECASCHDSTAWSPARYDRAHTFPINHGESGPSPCRTCHPTTLSDYTCYGCHEHDPADLERKHREEGISDFQDCARCHPTGQKDEGGED